MSKEAMKLALEAMRGVIAWHIMRNHMVPYRVRDPLQEAITAISEALAEQPAQQEPDAIVTSLVAGPDGVILAGLDRELPLMTGVYLAPQPAQPQQEPVAVWELFEDGWDSIADPEWMETLPVGTKLYTSPPAQRTWVGLTDEEIEKVWRRVQANDFHDCVQPFARAIEAKLKEKNT